MQQVGNVMSAISMEEDNFDPVGNSSSLDNMFDSFDDNSLSQRGSSTAASSFVKKLFEMVEYENFDIISWTADGRSFEVRFQLTRTFLL